MNTVPVSGKRYTVMLVDDEENILNSLRRVLRGKPYDLLLATSGAQALSLFELHQIDLIVSDARMPAMDGPTLLSEVHRRDPECMTILLTGYADMSMITKAINEGHIFRYISKPWNDEELMLTLEQALEMQSVRRDRDALLTLADAQVEALREFNETLEQRVAARTSELQQTADMLDLAYDELKHSYVVCTEVFSSLVNQRLPRARQTNERVIEVVRAYCARHGVSEAESRNLSMAAALYNIGKLGWSDTMLSGCADLLLRTHAEEYKDYPGKGEALMMALEPLQDANPLILHHQEHWDGSGFPDRLKGQAIPLGARILKLAIDFVELQCGLVLDRYLTRDEVLAHLRHHKAHLYDPALIEGFIEVCLHHLPENFIDPSVKALEVRRLLPGMVLSRNLNASNGMLLLNEGKVLTALLIEKLLAFEAVDGGHFTVFVRADNAPRQVSQPQACAD
ncbi:HD domain-containing phosphohydrolase [Pseudomonas sp. CDFA 610]|uniref:HD domain-containing phosphohydrolase n=1 Tax=Pseudomonas sp. CDFA 610 TaxID=2829825 RepID=UPI001E39300B|nr:HD domain-containing phosphohydrolase [Pseudomonas sp. CDFA 610]MCD5983218.1 response regulator [Pseudomonas sp. CDFA 610]